MPGNLIPTPFYSPDEVEILRLSSKSHWDVPIQIGKKVVHFLVSHPTPPVFDGPEDRNGRRNHDEIRFWADYISPGKAGYIYDDGAARRPEAGRALRDRRRPELRPTRRGQHPGRDPAAARAPARQREGDAVERGRGRGDGTAGRRERDASERPAVRHGGLRGHRARQPARRLRAAAQVAPDRRLRGLLAGAVRSALPADRGLQLGELGPGRRLPDVGPPSVWVDVTVPGD